MRREVREHGEADGREAGADPEHVAEVRAQMPPRAGRPGPDGDRGRQPVRNRVVLQPERTRQPRARGRELPSPPRRRGQQQQRRGDRERDERLALAAHVDAAVALQRRIAEEEEQRRGCRADVGRESPPADRDEQQRDDDRGAEIGGGHDRRVRPDRLEARIQKLDPGRLLVPDVDIRHGAVPDLLAGVAVEALVAARGLDERGQAKRHECDDQNRPPPGHAGRRRRGRPCRSDGGVSRGGGHRGGQAVRIIASSHRRPARIDAGVALLHDQRACPRLPIGLPRQTSSSSSIPASTRSTGSRRSCWSTPAPAAE